MQFTPNARVLWSMKACGYNVKPGDKVSVIRGQWQTRSGTVLKADLVQKILIIAENRDPSVHCSFFISVSYS